MSKAQRQVEACGTEEDVICPWVLVWLHYLRMIQHNGAKIHMCDSHTLGNHLQLLLRGSTH